MLILLIQIIRSSFSNPGMQKFAKDFEEIGYYRNENNTGPVMRIYAVKSLHENSEAYMREFAEAQPHTKYGRTLVFFFTPEVSSGLELNPKDPYFPSRFEPFLLAKFEKTPMGESRFESKKP